ncbi:MAG: nitrous oxide reductase accessory protein NosL [Rhodospirillales bacterium]|nr:nitrous oxide reductase accessory protein NosL [Rhodospirillales bacterium]
MISRAALAIVASCWLGACSDGTATVPPAQEPRADTVGHICGMFLTEHPGPKGQVFVAGQSQPLWFSSVRDAIVFLRFGDGGASAVVAYVNDMGRADWTRPDPGTWIDARRAQFVLGSRRASGMGEAEAVPFIDREAARQFVARNGGTIAEFAEIPDDYLVNGRLDP